MGVLREAQMQCTEGMAKIAVIHEDKKDRSHCTIEQIHPPHHKPTKKDSQYIITTTDRPHTTS
jgi:hypothetical protein